MDLVVTGSGRMASRWLTSVLNTAGIPATHEGVYVPGVRITHSTPPAVEVSWLAVTHEHVPEPMVAVARHPLASIASLLDCGVMTARDGYNRAIRSKVGAAYWGEDPLWNAALWWTRAYTDPRLEKVIKLGTVSTEPEPFAHMLAGYTDASVPKVVEAIGSTPHDRHPIGARRTTLAWDDLPPHLRPDVERVWEEAL